MTRHGRRSHGGEAQGSAHRGTQSGGGLRQAAITSGSSLKPLTEPKKSPNFAKKSEKVPKLRQKNWSKLRNFGKQMEQISKKKSPRKNPNFFQNFAKKIDRKARQKILPKKMRKILPGKFGHIPRFCPGSLKKFQNFAKKIKKKFKTSPKKFENFSKFHPKKGQNFF